MAVNNGSALSHPSRGAWIEIPTSGGTHTVSWCRTPHGVRGLKYVQRAVGDGQSGRRTPHGVRGLKYCGQEEAEAREGVAPLTGCVD